MTTPTSALGEAAPPRLGEGLDFMRLLWALEHALARASRRMEAIIGLTGPQRLVIRIVGRFPGISPGHLAALLHVDPSTLTGVLGRLEGRGLLSRRRDPRDRRRVLLGLTAGGRAFDVESDGTIEHAVQQATASATPGQAEAAREMIELLTIRIRALS